MSSAPSARNTPQAASRQTTGDTQYNVRGAALLGATSAFSKPPVKPKPQVNTYTGGSNGAWLAATKVGTGSPRTASPVRSNWTGGSFTNRPNLSPLQVQSKSSSASTLDVPDAGFDRTPSPSNIAAKLAAARHSPLKPPPQPSRGRTASERDTNERDVLPPPGSVGNVLARLNPPSPQPFRRRSRSIGSQPAASTVRGRTAGESATDDSPIPPTTSLVKMFEQTRPTKPAKPNATPAVVSQAPPPVRSPNPQRTVNISRNIEPGGGDGTQELLHSAPPVKPKPKPQARAPLAAEESEEHINFGNLRKDSLGTPPVKQKPAQLTAVKSATPRPKPPPQRGSRPRSAEQTRSTSFYRRPSTSLDSNENMSSPSSYASAREEQFEEKPRPSLPPPRRSTKPRSEHPNRTPSAVRPKTALPPNPPTPNKNTSPIHPPERFVSRRSSSAMGSSPNNETIYHSPYQRESVKAISKHMTGESLSNAIVGAALASSRNASPAAHAHPSSTSTPPLPIRRPHHHHVAHPFHSRSPSPPKSTAAAKPAPGKLRTTMRKEASSSSDHDSSEKYKRKGTRIMGMGRKHPNKHHEGARKRWRDTVTERERKRYEGVWAANKGLYIPTNTPPAPAEATPVELDVVNLVTKELWARSRLSEHVLEEVWELVDGRGVGRLRREEFVVGMWLIDQRLKGRKLPVRVSESVWGSVRGVGVRVRVKS
ncbi:hypothetical protein BCR34DRAFT_575417 [Clohesyomyces aquaticus]|uniref:EH domain-containing protein n=1 Tax=Clohesyomyces aquaticus TaxID=1231657 RepID=A0A1Y1YRT3_9PLEO|nr:hypothetical protein BCR34DRAFT_575417 [Clohesyomyces aquaticus]